VCGLDCSSRGSAGLIQVGLLCVDWTVQAVVQLVSYRYDCVCVCGLDCSSRGSAGLVRSAGLIQV